MPGSAEQFGQDSDKILRRVAIVNCSVKGAGALFWTPIMRYDAERGTEHGPLVNTTRARGWLVFTGELDHEVPHVHSEVLA